MDIPIINTLIVETPIGLVITVISASEVELAVHLKEHMHIFIMKENLTLMLLKD